MVINIWLIEQPYYTIFRLLCCWTEKPQAIVWTSVLFESRCSGLTWTRTWSRHGGDGRRRRWTRWPPSPRRPREGSGCSGCSSPCGPPAHREVMLVQLQAICKPYRKRWRIANTQPLKGSQWNHDVHWLLWLVFNSWLRSWAIFFKGYFGFIILPLCCLIAVEESGAIPHLMTMRQSSNMTDFMNWSFDTAGRYVPYKVVSMLFAIDWQYEPSENPLLWASIKRSSPRLGTEAAVISGAACWAGSELQSLRRTRLTHSEHRPHSLRDGGK